MSIRGGEVLNAGHADWPLLEVTLYGSRSELAKLGKRIRCGLHGVPVRVKVCKMLDLLAAAEQGLARLPAIMVGDVVISEGWIQTEELARRLSGLIESNRFPSGSGAVP